MPDVWTIVKENSSLESGDFWEHLNNQVGGTGTGLILIDGLEVLVDDLAMNALLDLNPIDINIKFEYIVEIEY